MGSRYLCVQRNCGNAGSGRVIVASKTAKPICKECGEMLVEVDECLDFHGFRFALGIIALLILVTLGGAALHPEFREFVLQPIRAQKERQEQARVRELLEAEEREAGIVRISLMNMQRLADDMLKTEIRILMVKRLAVDGLSVRDHELEEDQHLIDSLEQSIAAKLPEYRALLIRVISFRKTTLHGQRLATGEVAIKGIFGDMEAQSGVALGEGNSRVRTVLRKHVLSLDEPIPSEEVLRESFSVEANRIYENKRR